MSDFGSFAAPDRRIISDPPLIVPIEDVLPEDDHLGLVESMR